jgi:hypothetical protein
MPVSLPFGSDPLEVLKIQFFNALEHPPDSGAELARKSTRART